MSKRSPQLLLEDIIASANKIMGIDYNIVWLIKENFLLPMIAEIKTI